MKSGAEMDHSQVKESPGATIHSHKGHHGSHHLDCPSCGARTAIRTHRSGIGEYLKSLIGIYPFFCENCKVRFHRFRNRPVKIHIERWTRCPRCGFTEVNPVSKDRVPRSLANYWCRIVGIPSYRCPECRTKFFSIRPRKKTPAPKP
jgi:DNA-directed RNA polymerase subunit RPC12/RpoP